MFRSIRARTLAAFSLALAAFIGALGYGLVQLQGIGEGLMVVNLGYLPLARTTAEIDAIVRQMDREHDRYAREESRPTAGLKSNTGFYSASLEDSIGRAHGVATEAHGAISQREERVALELAMMLLAELDTHRQGYVEAVEQGLGEPADAPSGKALADLDRRRTDLVLNTGRLSALVEQRIEVVSERTAAAQTRATAVSGSLAALAVLFAGLMAAVVLITLRPISRLTEQVQRLARGETAGRVDVASRDEVGVLATEFNAMADAVAERDRALKERAAALDRLSLRLRGVLDAIHSGLLVSREGVVTVLNPAAVDLWGAQEGAPVPAPLATLDIGRHEALALGDRSFDVDVVPFGPEGMLLVGEDVTERNRVRERLARSERLALVGQMLAQITHEVRNPLNAMSLNAELLTEELTDGEQRAMLETITGEIRRLEHLTARYLDLSRDRTPEPAPTEVARLLAEVLRVEGAALQQAGVDVLLHNPDAPMVELDGDALRRAVRNIVRNAVEAGATRLEVGFVQSRAEVVVQIADDGPGMDEDQENRAFDPFFTTKARGTGLGLAISRQELERVGGSLGCVETGPRGTRFELRVPVG